MQNLLSSTTGNGAKSASTRVAKASCEVSANGNKHKNRKGNPSRYEKVFFEWEGDEKIRHNKRYKNMKYLARQGIPHNLRARIWTLVSSAAELQSHQPGLYKDLTQRQERMQLRHKLHQQRERTQRQEQIHQEKLDRCDQQRQWQQNRLMNYVHAPQHASTAQKLTRYQPPQNSQPCRPPPPPTEKNQHRRQFQNQVIFRHHHQKQQQQQQQQQQQAEVGFGCMPRETLSKPLVEPETKPDSTEADNTQDEDVGNGGVIEVDLHRTFPDHKQLSSEHGQQVLRRVLRAYSLHHPKIGYCQGMNFIAGLFLSVVGQEDQAQEEQAFWLLASMVGETSHRHRYKGIPFNRLCPN
jgi:hypothetical protein